MQRAAAQRAHEDAFAENATALALEMSLADA